MTSAQEKKIRQTGCDARFDNLTRKLYATDASIYQIEPLGVAFPRNAQQASAVIRAAADTCVPVTPRGAGTSLVGNAIGDTFQGAQNWPFGSALSISLMAALSIFVVVYILFATKEEQFGA